LKTKVLALYHQINQPQDGIVVIKDPLIGKVLHDTHEVLRLIGKGGMGSVYEARHIHLNKSFAVKVLDPRFAENDTVFARFKREALIASSIGHPAIVQVSDFYLHEDGRPCMVMEYLEGQDLGEVLKERKSLPPEEVVEIVEQVAGALQAVHDQDIVHRDMKPGNIFLVKTTDSTIQAKVLDFGISKIKNPEDGVETLTAAATILGTPHFMSPEQALGEVGDVDWRTDIFALGTICYYALCGKLPFNAPSLHGVLVKIQTMEPPPITGFATGLTGKAHLALQKAMAKEKTDRYDRVEQFAVDLKAGLAVPASAPEEKAETPEFATLVDIDAKPPGEKEPEEAPEQPGEGALPAEDPNITNVLPLDELLGEVGQAGDGAIDEEGSEGAAEDSDSPAREEAPAEEKQVEPPAGEETEHLEVEDLEEVPPTAEEADAPAPQAGEEYAEAVEEQAPEVQKPAASPPVLETPAPDEEAVASPAPVEEEPRQVSPHTTLSGSAGEMPTEDVRPAPDKKQLSVKALATAAVLVLVLGGAFMFMRGAGDQSGTDGEQPATVAAGAVQEPPSEPARQEEPPPPPAQEPVPEPKQPPPPTASQARITLQLSPAEARVLLDGAPRDDNPLLLPMDGKQHRLRVEAKGFTPHEQDLKADTDRTVKVALARIPPAPAKSRAQTRKARTVNKSDDWGDPFKTGKKPRPAPKKAAEDEGFSTLAAPKPGPKKQKKKKKRGEEAFDSL